MSLSVSLAPRDEAALTTFIASASTVGSPDYHHYLAPGQFASQFGPSAQTISAVEAQLHSLGIGTTTLSSDHLFITTSASAAQVESAFHVQLERFRLSDGSVGFINTQTPLVSGALSSPAVVAILGMNSLARPRPLLAPTSDRKAAGHAPQADDAPSSQLTPDVVGPHACAAASTASSANGGYTDTQIAHAYQLSSLYADGATGQNQTVALYELEPFSSSDLAAFQKCYGTSVPVSVIPEYGGAGNGPGSGESILDIDNIVALAPGATLLVYEGPGNTDAQWVGEYDDMVAPDNAKALSTSWGLCERDEGVSTIKAEYPVFQEAASYGETFYAAAGDDGSEDCLGDDTPNDGILAVDDPGSQPYVVSVGGLRLESLTPKEKVWNDRSDGDGAGGGGISMEWPMPTWQTGTGVINNYSTDKPCKSTTTLCREVPDVSGDADPDQGGWTYYYEGQWQGGQGGTSAAAPLWAALTAVINSQCKSGSVGFDAPKLYEAAATVGNFTDVTVGNNDYTGTHGIRYPATPGYNMASGLGSPLAAGLANSLC
jgi:subtilase family serine protease